MKLTMASIDCPVANLPQEILSEIIHHLSKTNMGSLYSVCFGLTCKSIYALHWKKYGKINIYPYDYMADIGGSPIDPLFTSWFAKQGYSRAGVQSKFEPRDSKERKVKRLLSRIF